jgi:hypothetical protein
LYPWRPRGQSIRRQLLELTSRSIGRHCDDGSAAATRPDAGWAGARRWRQPLMATDWNTVGGGTERAPHEPPDAARHASSMGRPFATGRVAPGQRGYHRCRMTVAYVSRRPANPARPASRDRPAVAAGVPKDELASRDFYDVWPPTLRSAISAQGGAGGRYR